MADFTISEGGPFTKPHEMVIDEVQAKTEHLHPGSTVNYGNKWTVTGVVESGKLSRMFGQIEPLQEEFSQTGKVSVVWVKVDDPANIQLVIKELQDKLDDYKVLTMDEMTSLLSANNVPILQGSRKWSSASRSWWAFWLFLSRCIRSRAGAYARDRNFESTRRIARLCDGNPDSGDGFAHAAIVGSIFGILMTYGAQILMRTFAPTFPMLIVKSWWIRTAALALAGSLVGALGPGFKSGAAGCD